MPTPLGEKLTHEAKEFVEGLLEVDLPDDTGKITALFHRSEQARILLEAVKDLSEVRLVTDLLEYYLRSLVYAKDQRLKRPTMQAYQIREGVKSRILSRVGRQQYFLVFDALNFAAESVPEHKLDHEIERVEHKLCFQSQLKEPESSKTVRKTKKAKKGRRKCCTA